MVGDGLEDAHIHHIIQKFFDSIKLSPTLPSIPIDTFSYTISRASSSNSSVHSRLFSPSSEDGSIEGSLVELDLFSNISPMQDEAEGGISFEQFAYLLRDNEVARKMVIEL